MIEIAAIILGISYVVWGVFHHWRRGDLHPKIVLEYVGLAILGIAAVMSVARNL